MGDLNDLAEKFRNIADKDMTKITKVILKEALKETNARQDLISYIRSHFKTRTGTYAKSVSPVKADRVRSDHNRVISYIYFLPVDKIKHAKAKSEKQRQRYYEQIIKIENQLKNQFKGRRKDKQTGAKVKGITAHHFIDAIQKRVDSQAADIVTRELTQAISDLLK